MMKLARLIFMLWLPVLAAVMPSAVNKAADSGYIVSPSVIGRRFAAGRRGTDLLIPTTYYLSSSGTFGTYANPGSDASAGTTPATAWLTVAKCFTGAATGDTVLVNPSSSFTVSSQSMNKGITFKADPTYAVFPGTLPTLTITATNALSIAASNLTVSGFNIDAATNAYNAFSMGGAFTGVLVQQCRFKGMTSTAQAFHLSNNSAWSITIDLCWMLASDNNAVTTVFDQWGSANGATCAVNGCSVNGLTSGNVLLPANTGTQTAGLGSDNVTRNTFTNCSKGVADSGGTIALSVAHTDFVGGASGVTTRGFSGSSTATYTTFAWNDCTFQNVTNSIWLSSTAQSISGYSVTNCTFNSSGTPALYCQSALTNPVITGNYFSGILAKLQFLNSQITGLTFANNVSYQNSSNTAADVEFIFAPIGAGFVATGNYLVCDTSAKLFTVGNDGYTNTYANTGANTTSQNLGSAAGNKYVASVITSKNDTLQGNYIGAVNISLKKSGSPTSTISCTLQTVSAGAPTGVVVATGKVPLGASATTANCPASILTTSYQQIRFEFRDSRYSLPLNTQLAVVWQLSAVDASNFVVIDCNATATTFGTNQISADGASYSGGTGSPRMGVITANFECQNPIISGNTLITTNPSAATHVLLVGATTGATVKGNLVKGGAIGIIFKLVDGSVGGLPAIASGNLITLSNTGGYGTMFDKASKNAQFLNNTGCITGSSNGAGYMTGGEGPPQVGTPYNGTSCENPTCENCIFDMQGAGTGFGLSIGYGDAVLSGYTTLGATINYNDIYVASGSNFGRTSLGTTSGNTNYANLAAWQVTGFDANSISSDPLLVNSAPSVTSDFIPASTSPVVKVGLDLSATVPTDFFGHSILAWQPFMGAVTPQGSRATNGSAHIIG